MSVFIAERVYRQPRWLHSVGQPSTCSSLTWACPKQLEMAQNSSRSFLHGDEGTRFTTYLLPGSDSAAN